MYGTVKCLPMSRRKSISDSGPEPVEVVDHDRARRPGVKSRNRSSWPRIAATFASSVVAIEQVPLGRPPGRIADHPRPAADERDRAAAEALQPEQPEDRDEVADVERVGRRVEPDVAGDRPAGRQTRRQARCRGVQDAPPLELRQQAARPRRRARLVTGWRRRAVSTSGKAPTRSFTPPMLSCGHRCRPASRGASAIDGRSSADRKAGPERPSVRSSSSSSSVMLS